MNRLGRWVPALLLTGGCLLNSSLTARRAASTPLRAPILGIGTTLLNTPAVDDTVDEEQRRVAGMSSYVMRHYLPTDDHSPFAIYVGYYDEQHQGKSIHSPKNCLPGAGWEQVESGAMTIDTPSGPVTVNRYRVANHGVNALVYYWYQGRGRVAHSELRIKYELLRDAVLRGRTEEALVRIVVDLKNNDPGPADRIARELVPTLVAQVNTVLPIF